MADADGDVDALEREVEEAILQAQIEANPGVLRHQPGHVWNDALETERDRSRELERALVTGSSPRGLRFFDLAKHAKARLVVPAPRQRDLHPPRGAPEKRRPKVLFQRRDLPAHRPRRDAQLLGRRRIGHRRRNIGSAAGHKAMPGGSHYGATKAAVESLTRSWAVELAPFGVRVNTIAPGPTDTPVFEKLGLPREGVAAAKAQFVKQVPLGRIASTDEIAHWIVAVADPSVTWLTGQILSIDGGMSLT